MKVLGAFAMDPNVVVAPQGIELGVPRIADMCHVSRRRSLTPRVGTPGEDEASMLELLSESRPNSRCLARSNSMSNRR